MRDENWTVSNIQDWNVVSLVRQQAQKYGDRTFITFESGASLTFQDLDRKSDEFAHALKNFGIIAGNRIFCVLKNSPDFLISMFGIMKAEAVFVPINTELKGLFLQHQFTNCAPKMVIVEQSLIKAFAGLNPLDADLGVVVISGNNEVVDLPRALQAEETHSFGDFIAESVDCPVITFVPSIHTICAIMYTSGTSGPSKGVLLPHGHFFSYAVGQVDGLKQTEDDIYYICMPLFHVNALNMQFIGCLIAGSAIFCVERFSTTNWLRHCIDSGATLTNTLGVMTEFVFNTPETDLDQQHALRLICAVPIAKEWGEKFQTRFGVKLYQAFGMTESGIVFWGDLSEDELIPGCTGYLKSDLYEAVIANPKNDELLKIGEIGELLIRPRYAGVFSSGYFEMPDKTVEAWRNLWFHTGDACYFDDKGRMHYFDRIKDCVRRRGENISAYEVEQALNSYKAVLESAVIGVKTDEAGGEEEVLAIVVAASKESFDFDKLIEYCTQIMPKFAVPRFIQIADALPKTSSGKLSKAIFRNKGLSAQVWDREKK
ncbi:MAG: AMP-binding protein [Paracoccaceae bacterium]|nr:AMP-binding protein [Paracoccaceae bacterium]